MTPEEKIAEFLANLNRHLERQLIVGQLRLQIVSAATPAVTEYYLKGI